MLTTDDLCAALIPEEEGLEIEINGERCRSSQTGRFKRSVA